MVIFHFSLLFFCFEEVRTVKSYICGLFGVIGSSLAFLFGGWDESIITLLMFMIIDYVTGLLVAGVFHKSKKSYSGGLESGACYKGLVRKGMILLFVVIGNRLDMQLGSTYVRDGVCIAFIVNEVISIIENARLMGIPIPKVIEKALDVMNKEEDKK